MERIYKKIYNSKNSVKKTLMLNPSNNEFIDKLSKELGITYTNTINLIIESFISDLDIEEVEDVKFIGKIV